MAIVKMINDPEVLANDILSPENLYNQHFSYDGSIKLMEYMIQLSEDLDEHIPYDPIAWCCDYTEYENLDEYNNDYNTSYTNLEDIDSLVCILDNNKGFIVRNK